MDFDTICYSRALMVTDKITRQEYIFSKVSLLVEGFYHFWIFVNCTPAEALQFTAEMYLDPGNEVLRCPLGPKSPLPVISIEIATRDIIKNNLALKFSKEETVFVRERVEPWKVKFVGKPPALLPIDTSSTNEE